MGGSSCIGSNGGHGERESFLRVEGRASAFAHPTIIECGMVRRSLQTHVLGEIVAWTARALKLPADRGGVIAAAKHLGQEPLLRRPTGVGLRLAIAARHGVVEPAMRRVFVDMAVVALLMAFEAFGEAPNV